MNLVDPIKPFVSDNRPAPMNKINAKTKNVAYIGCISRGKDVENSGSASQAVYNYQSLSVNNN